MKLSIIIPCYNQADYLSEAIGSALDQTYKDIEIIVINDGSPDATKEVAEKYPVKVINQVNKGLASARNTGIMNATGDYILPLDSDDILLPNCIEKIVEKVQKTGVSIISPSFRAFGARQGDVILMDKPTLKDFTTGNRVGYCSAIKRDALLECGGYSPRMVEGYEDYHLWHDLLSRGKKIETIPEVLWLYRTKENSMYTQAVVHHDKLMDQIKKDFPEAYA